MARPRSAGTKDTRAFSPGVNRFTSLSLRDLLDARDAYHVHLSHI